jgi:hypothetical protein
MYIKVEVHSDLRNEALTQVGECLYMEAKQFSEAEIPYTTLYFGWTQFDSLLRRRLSRVLQETAQSLYANLRRLPNYLTSFKILSNLLMNPRSTLNII